MDRLSAILLVIALLLTAAAIITTTASSVSNSGSNFGKEPETHPSLIPVSDDERFSHGFRYTLINNGQEVQIEGVLRPNVPHITIPVSLDGKMVTSINSNAFSGCEETASISIPGTVISIGKGALIRCPQLMSVYFDGPKDQWLALNCDTDAAIHYRLEPNDALWGDVDGDGRVTSTDARLTLLVAVDKPGTEHMRQPSMADVDRNGRITSVDARLVLELAAGKLELKIDDT